MNTPLKWMALAGLVWLMAGGATAEEFVERPANSAQEGHRFLFVVETSAGNRKAENNYRQALFDLIVGGVNGNMYSGDSYGIWTFNEEVHSGEFPLTIWEKGQSLDLASQAAAFLQKQKYTKKASLSFLVDSLRRLSDRVNDVNVFIISSGEDPIAGTPFDQNINAAYKALAKQSAKTGRPMVTSFAVRKGRPVRSGVVLAGDRIVLPDRPPEQIALPPKRSPVVTNSAQAALARATTNSQVIPDPPRKKVMQIVTKTNSVTSPPIAAAPSTPASAVTIPTAPGAGTGSIEQTNAARNETPAVAAVGAILPATLAPTTPIATASPPPAPSPAPPATVANSMSLTPASAVTTAAATTNNATATAPQQGASVDPRPTSNAVVANPATTTGPALGKSMVWEELSTVSAPAGHVASKSTNATTAGALVVMAREAFAGSNSSAVPPEGSAMQGTMVLVRTIDGLSAGVLLAIGATLFAAATFLLVLLLRRSAPAPARGSLITQAMRPERKV